MARRAAADLRVVDRVQEIFEPEHARKEEHGQAERDVAVVGQRFEPPPRRGPLRDGRVAADVGHVHPIDREVGPGEQRAHGHAEQQRPRHAVDDEERVVGPLAEKVIGLAPELVGHSLDHENEQNGHPDVERTPEARAVKERERGEERAAERNERREGELPLAPERVDDHRALLVGASDRVKQPLSALDEEQEDEQRAEQRNDQPPVVLKQN